MKTIPIILVLFLTVSAGAEVKARRTAERTKAEAVDGKVQVVYIHGKYEEYQLMTKETATKLWYQLGDVIQGEK